MNEEKKINDEKKLEDVTGGLSGAVADRQYEGIADILAMQRELDKKRKETEKK